MMDRCMETMGSMMDGGIMGTDGGWLSGLLLVGLFLLLLWVLGVAAIGALGIWAFGRPRQGSTRA